MRKSLLSVILAILLISGLLTIPTTTHAEGEFVAFRPINGTDMVSVYEKPSEKASIVGEFYGGFKTTVYGHKGEWTRIYCPGIGDAYVLNELLIYDEARFSVPMKTPIMAVSPPSGEKSIPFYFFLPIDDNSEADFMLIEDTPVQVYGYVGDWCYVQMGDDYGYLKPDHLKETDFAPCNLQDINPFAWGEMLETKYPIYFYRAPDNEYKGTEWTDSSVLGHHRIEILIEFDDWCLIYFNIHLRFMRKTDLTLHYYAPQP